MFLFKNKRFIEYFSSYFASHDQVPSLLCGR